jgi:hypothetical protein
MSVVGILGKKVGMTQIFDDRGDVHPVTVLKAGPCVITQIKTLLKDGYEAAQIGYVDFVKASKVNKAMTGHFAKSNVPPVRMIKEVALESVKGENGESTVTVKAGDRILVDIFNDERFVGPWIRGRYPPPWLRWWSQVARSHVPGAGLDRRFVVPLARLPGPAHAGSHGPCPGDGA